MLHDALYSQNSLKNFSSKIAWVWLTYIWPFLYYKKTILEWNSGNFWRKIFEGILWIRGIMEHQLRPPRGFVDIFNPFSLKNLESHILHFPKKYPWQFFFSYNAENILVSYYVAAASQAIWLNLSHLKLFSGRFFRKI